MREPDTDVFTRLALDRERSAVLVGYFVREDDEETTLFGVERTFFEATRSSPSCFAAWPRFDVSDDADSPDPDLYLVLNFSGADPP